MYRARATVSRLFSREGKNVTVQNLIDALDRGSVYDRDFDGLVRVVPGFLFSVASTLTAIALVNDGGFQKYMERQGETSATGNPLLSYVYGYISRVALDIYQDEKRQTSSRDGDWYRAQDEIAAQLRRDLVRMNILNPE